MDSRSVNYPSTHLYVTNHSMVLPPTIMNEKNNFASSLTDSPRKPLVVCPPLYSQPPHTTWSQREDVLFTRARNGGRFLQLGKKGAPTENCAMINVPCVCTDQIVFVHRPHSDCGLCSHLSRNIPPVPFPSFFFSLTSTHGWSLWRPTTFWEWKRTHSEGGLLLHRCTWFLCLGVPLLKTAFTRRCRIVKLSLWYSNEEVFREMFYCWNEVCRAPEMLSVK